MLYAMLCVGNKFESLSWEKGETNSPENLTLVKINLIKISCQT